MKIQMQQVSSLEKIFSDAAEAGQPLCSFSALRGEEFHYQVALKQEEHTRAFLSVEAASCLPVQLFWVEEVPCQTIALEGGIDDDYLFTAPRMVPDVLHPVTDSVLLRRGQWVPIFVSVSVPEDARPGAYPITVKAGESSVTFLLTVIDAVLPAQTLTVTQWFHSDCIADYYGLEAFSDAHFERIEQALRVAGHYGQNMILTPVFTPALDTRIGGERTTVQLVGIEKNGDQYTFDFSLLTRFVRIAQRCGMYYFEIAHLFTQWGAKATPKIMVKENGVLSRRFGWDVEATDPAYVNFLQQFIPALLVHLHSLGLQKEQIYFHLSDEPSTEADLEQFRKIQAFLQPLTEGYHHMDALSHYEYYAQGLVECPVVATNAAAPFLEADVRPRWVYYCCAQFKDHLSNRLMAMPSYRTRAIGAQLFTIDADGFLQWGMNFYNSSLSLRHIDPFRVTDADGSFQSGDSFVIYPGEEEALAALRLAVFFDGLQDLRALQLLASLVGREEALRILAEAAGAPYTLNSYPVGVVPTLQVRNAVNAAIAQALAQGK